MCCSETVAAWEQVTKWLKTNAPVNYATLHGPATEEALSAAEAGIGVRLTPEIREWLSVNNGVRTEADPDDGSTSACEGGDFLDCGYYLLSASEMVRVHRHMTHVAEGDETFWSKEWIPVAAECDVLCGVFIDSRDGAVSTWGDYGEKRFGTHQSLADYFRRLMNEFTERGSVVDGALDWD